MVALERTHPALAGLRTIADARERIAELDRERRRLYAQLNAPGWLDGREALTARLTEIASDREVLQLAINAASARARGERERQRAAETWQAAGERATAPAMPAARAVAAESTAAASGPGEVSTAGDTRVVVAVVERMPVRRDVARLRAPRRNWLAMLEG